MTTAFACGRCKAPIFSEDRYCGVCGAPQTPPPGGGPSANVASDHAAKLLAQLQRATAGEYEIRGEIGRGGMAVVYLAYDLRLNRKVAIKAMLPELAYHDGMEERFKREARTAAKLDHPNIVVIYTVRDWGDLLFFVMKFIDGAPLDALIRAHAPFPIHIVQGLLVQLGSALQYAHDEGVVHRDVKPANVIIDGRGGVQVTDFGIAKVTESAHLTRTGTAIGTPAYMSPEQCLGKTQFAASDQYSVGVLAYELIGGATPFTGPGVEMQWAHVKEPPRPLLELRPDCPPALADAVMRMLAKQPSDRWPSLRDAMPIIASGLSADADLARPALSAMVRLAAPSSPPPFAITPASPIPKRLEAAPPPRPRAISIVVAAPVVEVGASVQLDLEVDDSQASVAQRDAVAWQSTQPAILGVSSRGVVTGMSPGIGTITAALEGLTTQCHMVVEAARVASIEVKPTRCRVEVGTSETFECLLRDARGAIVRGTSSWSSSKPSIASVSDTGTVTAHAIGSVTIAAMIDDLAATAVVDVVPQVVTAVSIEPSRVVVGEFGSARLVSRAVGRSGAPIENRETIWTTANADVASVDRAGVIRAVGIGRTTVTARVDGITSSAEIVIEPASVAALTLTPKELTIAKGDTAPLAVVATDSDGRILSGRSVEWSSSDRAIAQVDPSGCVVSKRVGSVIVTATVDRVSATCVVAIVHPPVSALEIKAPRRPMRTGGRARLRVVARDRGGSPTEAGPVRWTTSDASITELSDDGTITALKPGNVSVSVSAGECVAAVDITVVEATGVSRRTALLMAGALAALVTVALIVWKQSPSENAVATVATPTSASPGSDSLGVRVAAALPPATAVDSGTSRVEPAVVLDTAVAAVAITPASPISIEVGEGIQLTAVASNKAGERVARRARVQWRLANPSVATISATGLATGTAPGRTSVTVTIRERAQAVQLVVREAAPASVSVVIGRDSLRVGETTTATAQVFDLRGAILDHAVVWHSSNQSVAVVDSRGVVRATGVGQAAVSATVGGIADSVQLLVPVAPVATAGVVASSAQTRPPVVAPQPAATLPRPVTLAAPDAASKNAATVSVSDAEARTVADSIIGMVSRRQTPRLSQLGADDAKSLSEFLKFLDKNHPSARLGAAPVVGSVTGTRARITLAVTLQWRTISTPRRDRTVTIDGVLEHVPGGWSIRQLRFPDGFEQ